MLTYIYLYLATIPVFFGIDMLWLGVIAKSFYRAQLGYLLRADVVWWAAILFYLLFLVGILVFAAVPGIEARSIGKAVFLGALFGLLAYATYDLTNYATVRDWPLVVVFADMAWGAVLSGTVAAAAYVIGTRFLSL